LAIREAKHSRLAQRRVLRDRWHFAREVYQAIGACIR
jgi:hypothetical protein